MKIRTIQILILLLLVFLVQVAMGQDVFQAADQGDLELVQKLVGEKSGRVWSVDSNRKTPLHFAAHKGHEKVVEFLLDRGAVVDAPNVNGTTPLMYAAAAGQTDVVRLLLDHGANIDSTQPETGLTALFFAIQGRHTDTVTLLCDRGVNVGRRDHQGKSPLLHAVQAGAADLAGLLLDRGAPVDLSTGGWQLLYGAAAGGMTRVVRELIVQGADVNGTDPYGNRLLETARAGGHTELAAMLIEKGAREISTADRRYRERFPGEKTPGAKPELFAPRWISTREGDERDICFSRDFQEIYFTRDGKIHRSVKKEGTWTPPEVVSFSGKYLDFEACLTPDGNRLFYISRRPAGGEEGPLAWEIYMVERRETGWGTPRMLGDPFGGGFYPTFTDEWVMYFTDRDQDISRTTFANGRFGPPEKLGPDINTPGPEYNSFIAPDESYLIFNTHGRGDGFGDGDLYVSFRRGNGSWTVPENMGSEVNSSVMDYCPSVSPDGRFFFFASARLGNEDIYWMDASIIRRFRQEVLGAKKPAVIRSR